MSELLLHVLSFLLGSSQPIRKDHSQGGTACNCIDEVIRIRRPINER